MAIKAEQKLLLATTNRGKAAEFFPFFQTSGITLLSLADFPDSPEISETGRSFKENAILKARTIAKHFGLPALADDSGLVIPALDGEPGIFSSRYGQEMPLLPGETKDVRNLRKLLGKLAGKTGLDRQGYFKTVLAVSSPQGKILTVCGEWHGEILLQARGSNGFGYDPIFYDPSLGKTAAEMSREEKFSVSHRGQALKRLMNVLPAFLRGASDGTN